jgi:hypothetical protein
MNILTSQKQPTLPLTAPGKVGFQPTEKTTITRTFDVPVTQSEHLGNMPSDTYEHNWYGHGTTWTRTESHGCYGGKCTAGPVSVHRDVPEYNADGTPKMRSVTETLSEESYNQKNRALTMTGIGAAVGAAGSALGGALFAGTPWSPLAMGVAAVVGAAGGFAVGHMTAAGDTVKEVWKTHSISHPTMTGYTETIRPDTYTEETNCRTDDKGKRTCDTDTKVRGYWHEYSPDIAWRQVGTYTRPALEHTAKVGPLGAGAITVAGAGLLGIGVKALLSAL